MCIIFVKSDEAKLLTGNISAYLLNNNLIKIN